MIRRWKQREHQPAQPLSTRAIVLWSVIVLVIGATGFAVLWWRYRGAGPEVELNAIRTAGALMVAAGGAVTLLLAARRQRSTEQALEHQRLTLEQQREADRATAQDAAERRITELYTRAVDQLGAEKAPVRLGGLHALERLAQDNPAQRQTIVDVICAYLRMPYTPPEDHAPGEDASEDAHRRYEQRCQELQVRLTAQRILTAHLNPEASAVFWTDITLDLTKAHLHELDLTFCHTRSARFEGATFTGTAMFAGAEFAGAAEFGYAKFSGEANFFEAEFAGDAGFMGAKFAGAAEFAGYAGFMGAHFSAVDFSGAANFFGAEFSGEAWFLAAKFAGDADFRVANFAGNTKFDHARVAPSARRIALPIGWITRVAQPAEGEEGGWLHVVPDEDSSEQSAEATNHGEDQTDGETRT